MAFGIDRIRKDFPALDQGVGYVDGPGGTQAPRQIGKAIASTITGGISNRGTVTIAERRAEDVVVAPVRRWRTCSGPRSGRGGIRAVDDAGDVRRVAGACEGVGARGTRSW